MLSNGVHINKQSIVRQDLPVYIYALTVFDGHLYPLLVVLIQSLYVCIGKAPLHCYHWQQYVVKDMLCNLCSSATQCSWVVNTLHLPWHECVLCFTKHSWWGHMRPSSNMPLNIYINNTNDPTAFNIWYDSFYYMDNAIVFLAPCFSSPQLGEKRGQYLLVYRYWGKMPVA